MKAIVAVDQNWGIGKDGDQLVYIHTDLRRFKELTTGHPIIYGRKTMATFPKGQPLKGRRNLVLSSSISDIPGAEIFKTVPSLLQAAPEDSFVIGGASVYQQLLPYCDTAYVTEVLSQYDADVFFPNLDTAPEWAIGERGDVIQEEQADGNVIRFRYTTYKRKD